MYIKPEKNTTEVALEEDTFRKEQDDGSKFELKREHGVQTLKSHFEGISTSQKQRLKGDDEEQFNCKAKSFKQNPMHGVKGLKSHFEKLYLSEEETGGTKNQRI